MVNQSVVVVEKKDPPRGIGYLSIGIGLGSILFHPALSFYLVPNDCEPYRTATGYLMDCYYANEQYKSDRQDMLLVMGIAAFITLLSFASIQDFKQHWRMGLDVFLVTGAVINLLLILGAELYWEYLLIPAVPSLTVFGLAYLYRRMTYSPKVAPLPTQALSKPLGNLSSSKTNNDNGEIFLLKLQGAIQQFEAGKIDKKQFHTIKNQLINDL